MYSSQGLYVVEIFGDLATQQNNVKVNHFAPNVEYPNVIVTLVLTHSSVLTVKGEHKATDSVSKISI